MVQPKQYYLYQIYLQIAVCVRLIWTYFIAWRGISRPTNLKNFTKEEFNVGGKFLETLIRDVVDFSISTYTNMIWINILTLIADWEYYAV